MYENLVSQSVAKNLISDIKNDNFPGAVLFSGPESSGKLTAALETARILSCREQNQGKWTCACYNCKQQKSLTFSNLMLLGPRDCILEISASKKAFLEAAKQNAQFLTASHYLFVRSVRKLTLRFNGILWNDDKNITKIGNLIEEINENLEKIDVERKLPDYDVLEKICATIETQSAKLENEFLYDSIPINHIRNMEEWARKKSEYGKKTIILENADRTSVNVRNALLKILEEPPNDCEFILLTSKKNAIMQTILSRVRIYAFTERSPEEQKNVISRVFHNENFSSSINDYLQTFLPIPPEKILEQAQIFLKAVSERKIPDVADVVKKCGNFSPRIELKLFLSQIAQIQKKIIYTRRGAEVCAKSSKLLLECWDNIVLYNQSAVSALEILLKSMSVLNVQNDGVFSQIFENV